MVPTNFTLIAKNEEKGGSKSDKSAKFGTTGGRTAEESVEGKDDVNQFTDLSLPQGHTKQDTSMNEDNEVRELLGRFGQMNFVRAVLLGTGGIVGLAGALI